MSISCCYTLSVFVSSFYLYVLLSLSLRQIFRILLRLNAESSASAPTVCNPEQVSDLHRAPVYLALTIPPSSANGDPRRFLLVSKLQSFTRRRASMHTATKSARSPVSVTFGTQRSTLITRPPLRWDACFCKAIVTETARDLAAVGKRD